MYLRSVRQVEFSFCKPARASCFADRIKRNGKFSFFQKWFYRRLYIKVLAYFFHRPFSFLFSLPQTSLGFYNAAKKENGILVFTALCRKFQKVQNAYGFKIWHLKKRWRLLLFKQYNVSSNNLKHFTHPL